MTDVRWSLMPVDVDRFCWREACFYRPGWGAGESDGLKLREIFIIQQSYSRQEFSVETCGWKLLQNVGIQNF